MISEVQQRLPGGLLHSHNLVLRGVVERIDRVPYLLFLKKPVLVVKLNDESRDLFVSQVGPRLGTFQLPDKIGVGPEWFRDRECRMADFPTGSAVVLEVALGTHSSEYFCAIPIFAVAALRQA